MLRKLKDIGGFLGNTMPRNLEQGKMNPLLRASQQDQQIMPGSNHGWDHFMITGSQGVTMKMLIGQ